MQFSIEARLQLINYLNNKSNRLILHKYKKSSSTHDLQMYTRRTALNNPRITCTKQRPRNIKMGTYRVMFLWLILYGESLYSLQKINETQYNDLQLGFNTISSWNMYTHIYGPATYFSRIRTQNQGCHVGSIMHKFLGFKAASTNSVTPLCTGCGGSITFSSCIKKQT